MTTTRRTRAASPARPRQAARRERAAPSRPGELLVVGVGASAGGLEALSKLFDALPSDTGMAFVLIQHLDPTHKSMMAGLLGGHTAMTVQDAADGMVVESDHIYIIPPGTYLAIRDGVLRLTKPRDRHGARAAFDFFLRSLAEDCGKRAACVVLSGSGTDGSAGLTAVHDKGGLVIVQDPKDAGSDGMPRSAIRTGIADLVLPVAKIATALVDHGRRSRAGTAPGRSASDAGVAFAQIIELLRAQGAHDFALYREGTLRRQIERRMATASISDVGAYLDMLRKTPAELELLAKQMLINVTQFFRDERVFEILAETVIPDLVREQPLDQPIRVWDAGCSTGEETYSTAIVFLEEIAASKRNVKLKVFASDVDDDAVSTARNGLYPRSIEKDVSPSRLARFFVREGQGYRVTRELRETVVFTTQDLLADAPFSRLDFVCCRNVLIYLRPEVQEKVLALFHFALREGGILVLGGSETTGSLGHRFKAVSKKRRIFQHIGRSRPGEVEFPIAPLEGGRTTKSTAHFRPVATPHAKVGDLARQALLDAYAPASVLINLRHETQYFSGPIDRYLKIAAGEASRDLFVMARDGLRTKLRMATRQAVRNHGRIAVGGAQIDRDGTTVAVSISAQPIESLGETLLLVSFSDEPVRMPTRASRASAADLPHAAQLEAELDATRTELESAIHDLELSNDELTATNEEAMSVNEELQSTNEELEISKEELQSLNEELTALNSQLTETIDVKRATANDLQNTMNSADIAMLFLDSKLEIRFFTPAAKSMFSVIEADVGRPLADLARLSDDIHLLADARVVLANHVPISREVQTSGGAWFFRRVLPYRTQDDRVEGVVVTFADISEGKAAERAVEAARVYSDSIVNTLRQPLVVLDEALRVVSASPSFYRSFAVEPHETVGRHLDAVDDGRLYTAAVRSFLDRLRLGEAFIEDHEIEIDLPSVGIRALLVSAQEIRSEPRAGRKILVTIEDVTERKKANETLVAAKWMAEQANLGKSRFLAAASHDLRQPLQTLSLLQGILAKRIKDEIGSKLVVKLEETLGAMSGMLNTLLDINQLEAGIVQPEVAEFRIDGLLDRLKTEFTYHTTGKGIDWRVVGSGQTIRSDPRLLEQTLRNLLANAVKYTERGKILLGCRRRGGKLRVEVWDTGIGIPAGQLKSIFEEFHQIGNAARERSRGLGLGLSIVQRISDLLGHKVEVRSWPGGGSVFAIEVPIGAGVQALPSAIGKTEQVARPAGTVLIIEDDPAVREMLEILLDGEGYRTTAVIGADAALALAARRAVQPDVIIADYNLPGDLTGAEVIARLREVLHRQIPAIILTGDISSDTLRKIAHAGCVYLSKPATADVLTQQVQGLLDAKPQPVAPANAPPVARATGGVGPTIFVVDDDRVVLSDMQRLLQEHGHAAEAFSSGEAFLEADRPDRKGCLVVDALMPGMGGIALLERLKAANRGLPTIMITGQGDISMAVQAMKAGAADFLEKPVHPDALLASIGRAFVYMQDSAQLSAWRKTAADRIARLTPRERDVLDLVVKGRPNKLIADDLGISQRTVENHRAAVMKRTGVATLPDLIRLVMAAADGPSAAA